MTLSYIWLGFFLVAFAIAFVKWAFLNDPLIFKVIVDGIFKSAGDSVELSFKLIGIMTLFLGFMSTWTEFATSWLFLTNPKDFTLMMALVWALVWAPVSVLVPVLRCCAPAGAAVPARANSRVAHKVVADRQGRKAFMSWGRHSEGAEGQRRSCGGLCVNARIAPAKAHRGAPASGA